MPNAKVPNPAKEHTPAPQVDAAAVDKPGEPAPPEQLALGSELAADATALANTTAAATPMPAHSTEAGLGNTFQSPGRMTGDFGDLQRVPSENYTLGAEIARGGMGRIVQARDRRLGRTIAIKELLSPSPALEKRFEREMTITACLQHPSIINVLEAGRWPNGHVFYTMTLVEGRPLDKAIEANATLAERLALLPNVIDVSEAMAYAHQQGVIHRDLKPANILVGDFGQTIVIDWGLAKRLGQESESDDSDANLPSSPLAEADEQLTVLGRAMGTPAYMPPSQARGEALDERADVYALGAILYHLLSGQMPYTGAKSAREILGAVLKGPPKKLRSLVPDVPADLETIVEKAMARGDDERYPSAKGLAEDLRRFETGKLVSAHNYTASTLFRRWLKRHRAAASVGLLMILSLGAFGVWSFQRIGGERDRAEASRAITEDTMDFMLGDLREKLEPIGKVEVLRSVAARVANYYAERPVDWKRPQQVLNRSSALRNVGAVLRELGDLEGALSQYQQSHALLERLMSSNPKDLEIQNQYAIVLGRIGGVLQEQGNLKDALTFFETALATAKEMVAQAPDDRRWQHTLMSSYERLGYALKIKGDMPGALQQYDAAIPIAETLAKVAPDDLTQQHSLSTSYLSLGDLRWAQQDAEGALREYERAQGIARKITERDRENTDWQENAATISGRVGAAQMALRQYDKALVTYQATAESRKRLTELDPANASWQAAYAFSFNQTGDVLRHTGDLAGASKAYQQFIDMIERLAKEDGTNVRLRSLQASGHEGLANVLAEQEDLDGALRALEVAHGLYEELVAEDTASGDWKISLLNGYHSAAMLLRASDIPRAKHYASQCADVYAKISDSLAGSYLVASCFAVLDDADQAFAALDSAIDLGWQDAGELRDDAELNALKQDPRWARLLARLAAPDAETVSPPGN